MESLEWLSISYGEFYTVLKIDHNHLLSTRHLEIINLIWEWKPKEKWKASLTVSGCKIKWSRTLPLATIQARLWLDQWTVRGFCWEIGDTKQHEQKTDTLYLSTIYNNILGLSGLSEENENLNEQSVMNENPTPDEIS